MNNHQTIKVPNRRGCLWWVRRVLFGVIGLVLVSLLISTAYQAIASRMEASKYQVPGKLVDLGRYRLHLYCIGDGSPTVVLDSGLGGPALMWGAVQPDIASITRICSYDRAGLGWSDSVSTSRTSQNMVAELHTLLTTAGIEPPYVLVGHSLGGYNVRVYVAEYPEEVAGVVLVNAAHEDFSARIPAACRVEGANIGFSHLMGPLTTLGLTRVAGMFGLLDSITNQVAGNLPAEQQEELMALTFYHPQYWATFGAELSAVGESERQVSTAGSLGDIPLVVVSGQPDVGRVPPGCSVEEVVEISRALQVELASLSTNSIHTVCETCSHYIPMTDSELVVEAIRQVIDEIER